MEAAEDLSYSPVFVGVVGRGKGSIRKSAWAYPLTEEALIDRSVGSVIDPPASSTAQR